MFMLKSRLQGSTAAFCNHVHSSVCKLAKSLKRKTKTPPQLNILFLRQNNSEEDIAGDVEAPNN